VPVEDRASEFPTPAHTGAGPVCAEVLGMAAPSGLLRGPKQRPNQRSSVVRRRTSDRRGGLEATARDFRRAAASFSSCWRASMRSRSARARASRA